MRRLPCRCSMSRYCNLIVTLAQYGLDAPSAHSHRPDWVCDCEQFLFALTRTIRHGGNLRREPAIRTKLDPAAKRRGTLRLRANFLEKTMENGSKARRLCLSLRHQCFTPLRMQHRGGINRKQFRKRVRRRCRGPPALSINELMVAWIDDVGHVLWGCRNSGACSQD